MAPSLLLAKLFVIAVTLSLNTAVKGLQYGKYYFQQVTSKTSEIRYMVPEITSLDAQRSDLGEVYEFKPFPYGHLFVSASKKPLEVVPVGNSNTKFHLRYQGKFFVGISGSGNAYLQIKDPTIFQLEPAEADEEGVVNDGGDGAGTYYIRIVSGKKEGKWLVIKRTKPLFRLNVKATGYQKRSLWKITSVKAA